MNYTIFTFNRTIPQSSNFVSCKSNIVKLNARYFPLKPSFIPTICTKSYWILSTKLYLPDISTFHHLPIVPKLSYASGIVVRCTNVVPFASLSKEKILITFENSLSHKQQYFHTDSTQ